MANTSAIEEQVAHTTYQLPSPLHIRPTNYHLHCTYDLPITISAAHTTYQLPSPLHIRPTNYHLRCTYDLPITISAAHTTYQLPSPSCSTIAIQKKAYLLTKTFWRIFWKKKKLGVQTISRKNYEMESARGLGRKKRVNRKGESNDSPDIPDRWRQTPPASLQRMLNAKQPGLAETFFPWSVVMTTRTGPSQIITVSALCNAFSKSTQHSVLKTGGFGRKVIFFFFPLTFLFITNT